MTLGYLAKHYPGRQVRLRFRSPDGQEGALTCTADHALNPCASSRYFPPQGETPESLGWPVPYWYAEEIVAIEVPA